MFLQQIYYKLHAHLSDMHAFPFSEVAMVKIATSILPVDTTRQLLVYRCVYTWHPNMGNQYMKNKTTHPVFTYTHPFHCCLHVYNFILIQIFTGCNNSPYNSHHSLILKHTQKVYMKEAWGTTLIFVYFLQTCKHGLYIVRDCAEQAIEWKWRYFQKDLFSLLCLLCQNGMHYYPLSPPQHSTLFHSNMWVDAKPQEML